MNANRPAPEPATKQEKPVILITGVSGLLGTRIADRLAERFHIVGLDIAPPEHADLEFLKTDLTDDDSVQSSLQTLRVRRGPRIASVIHLAAYYDFSGEPSPLYEKLTVKGTRRLIRELHRQNLDVEQFVFSSSLLVMKPDAKGRRISELSETRAEWAYPQSKLQAEKIIHEERGRFPRSSCESPASMTKNAIRCPFPSRSPGFTKSNWKATCFPAMPLTGRPSSISKTWRTASSRWSTAAGNWGKSRCFSSPSRT